MLENSVQKVKTDSIVERLKLKVIQLWGATHWEAMFKIVNAESGFNPKAINKTSGACGLGQANPCEKLLAMCGSLDNIDCQIDWVTNYVANRYHTPVEAWNFWVLNKSY